MIGIDYVGPISVESNGNRYMLVITDYFSKWVEAFATVNADAITTAHILVKEIISRYGIPKKIVSDLGKVFLSDLIKDVNRLFMVEKLSTTPYHPQCDGLTERFNQIIIRLLKIYVQNNHYNWSFFLPVVLFAIRSTIVPNYGMSPYKILFGRDPTLPIHLTVPNPVTNLQVKNQKTYVENIQLVFNESYTVLRFLYAYAKEIQQNQYNKQVKKLQRYAVDQLVLVKNFHPADEDETNKFIPNWKGPFVITRVCSDEVVELNLPSTYSNKKVSVRNIKPFKHRIEKLNKKKPVDSQEYYNGPPILPLLYDMTKNQTPSFDPKKVLTTTPTPSVFKPILPVGASLKKSLISKGG
ncbi:polyprotein [Tieghemostelium lacteum]|nr:polyprotein [Tieghemostelium lacteum]|eukprot:KYQ88949.1 polyprotein [Tieghemostelium lacteum]